MSGWTALTIHTGDDELNEAVDKELREKYTGREPYAAGGYADRTVQVGRGADHRYEAKRFAEEYPEAELIVVVSANDTSDSGHGTLFEVDGGSVTEIDSKDGYEGARGNDVTGYFRDQYGIASYSSWEA